ncbi:MAG: response regulator transcription factor [Aquihabitans sp.]
MDGTPAPIRVFLLDDHEIVRRGLRDLLANEDGIEVVGECGTVADAIEAIASARPHVAILDVQLGDGSGIEVCRDLRSAHPEIASLMLTSYADDEAMLQSTMAGAAGYVLKQVRGNALVENIRAAAEGRSLLDPDLIERARNRLRVTRDADDRLRALTAQERKVLDLLAEGLTNRQIAERIHLAEKTVKNYVSNVLMKLDMQGRTEAAVYAARHQSAN